jgi:cytochrome c oxidase subunit III
MEDPRAAVRNLDAYRTAARGRAELTAWVGMVVFLASWAMLFASLFFAYAMVRARAPAWPPPDQPPLPIVLPAVNTAVVALSSAAMQRAVALVRHGRTRRGARSLGVAALLGLLFVGLQGVVWVRLYRDGLIPSGGPYPSAFYTLTCFHALHVAVGLAALAWLTVRARRGAYSALHHLALRLWAMYWHFVAAVWLVLYAILYLA